MTTRTAIAAATATTIVTPTAALATVVATGFSTRAEIAEFSSDLAVERVLEAHRHRTTRARAIA